MNRSIALRTALFGLLAAACTAQAHENPPTIDAALKLAKEQHLPVFIDFRRSGATRAISWPRMC